MRWIMQAALTLMLAIGAASPTAAQEGSEGAEAFVRSVYGLYSSDPDAPSPNVIGSALIWSPRMTALIARNEELAGDEMPYLDADPICNCQDWEDLRVLDTSVSRTSSGVRVVRVRFVNGGEEHESLLQMEGDPNSGWRIDDVLNPGYPSLAEQIEASNRRLETGGPVHD